MSRAAVRLVAAAAGTTAGWLLTSTWWAALVGLVAGVACGRWAAGQPTAAERAEQAWVNADLPFAVDLLAAALRSGSTPEAAVGLVGSALDGPLGERLTRVGRSLRLGATPREAWSLLGRVDGADRLVRAAERSGQTGSALAGFLHRVADDLRSDRLLAAEAAARRAGVLVVLPLGLCFLPAFVLTGLVPVVVAVVGNALKASNG